MSSDTEESTPNRRQFLRWVGYITAGITGLVAGSAAGIGILKLIKLASPDPVPHVTHERIIIKYEPAGDESIAINQQEVNRTYADLYKQFKQAKEQAEQEKKKLVILIGEDHKYRLCLINNLIVTDIAARLGIKDIVSETSLDLQLLSRDEAILLERFRKTEIGNARNRKFRNKDSKNLFINYEKLTPEDKRAVDLTTAVLYRINAIPEQEQKEEDSINCLSVFDVAQQMHFINGEPLNPRITGDKRLTPELEDKIIDTIKNVDKHRIAHYGLAHLLPIHNALKKDVGVHLVTLDTSRPF